MKILLAVAIVLPGGAAISALLIAIMQAAIGQNSYVTVGFALVCGSGVIYLADMRSKIVNRLDNHEAWESDIAKKLDSMVTHDALQLKIYEERARNDERYVQTADCGDQHKKLNGYLERAANHQAKAAGAGGD